MFNLYQDLTKFAAFSKAKLIPAKIASAINCAISPILNATLPDKQKVVVALGADPEGVAWVASDKAAKTVSKDTDVVPEVQSEDFGDDDDTVSSKPRNSKDSDRLGRRAAEFSGSAGSLKPSGDDPKIKPKVRVVLSLGP